VVDSNIAYAEFIRLADVTVRAVDDSSFYISARHGRDGIAARLPGGRSSRRGTRV